MKWDRLWRNLKSCRQTKLIIPKITNKFEHIASLPRPTAAKVTQFITGHGYFNYHQFKCGQTDDPLCRLCLEEDESAAHLLYDCPALELTRRRLIQNLDEISLGDIVSFIKTQQVSEIMAPPIGDAL